jgi:simple sugar transport system permease protein
MSAPMPLPRWADVALLPLVNVLAALFVSGLVVLAIGEDPLSATRLLVTGSLGSLSGLGYTLFYATNFIFTGLAVAVALHAGLFNIGGEGQAYVAGLGAALVCLHLSFLPGLILMPLGIAAAALAGAAWAFIPGYLQARRGSHIVITTIMFNWLATTLMSYLLVNVMRLPAQMNTETPPFAPQSNVPQLNALWHSLGVKVPDTPVNLSFVLALLAVAAVWWLIWRTRLGYEIRTVGTNATAAVYAGISPARITIIAMALSGALAGGLAVNELMGFQHRLMLEFTAGYGFVGIAVALMGRGHPVGILLAALLFGLLYQGGAELAFDQPKISRDMIVVIQGLVVLFAGALEGLFRRPLSRLFARRAPLRGTA